ncbi:molybdopterin-containing oxidoreductase family protein [Rhizorhabdus argentea]|uniref:molybdopterin-containing oxidoreductase family protein n=1 Tax=Rhizorhabdus argentea TaxID=1387174 RepID=UPI0030EB354F
MALISVAVARPGELFSYVNLEQRVRPDHLLRVLGTISVDRRSEVAKHVTYCRNCAALCGLEITEEGGTVTDIRGDRDHPISAGYFCIKGAATKAFHNGEDRLLNSMRRNAEGRFSPIGAELAMDEIHEKLIAIIAEHGVESVALYAGTGANCNALSVPMAKAWMDAIGSPYIFSSMTVDQSAKWVTAARMGVFATGKHRGPDVDVLMIVGSNPAASHGSFGLPPANAMKHVRSAKQAGMKLIVVDPRKTEIARAADIHVQLHPGQDATLFAGLIHMVLERNLADEVFCARFTMSRDRLRDAVDAFSPDYVAARTGVAIETLEQVVDMFTSARRKSAHSGTGPNMGPNSNLAEHMIETFTALCGGYRRAGDLLRNTGYYQGVPTREMVFPANRTWEGGAKLRTVDIGPIGGEYPTSRLPSEIIGNGDGKIRALIQVGGNLVKALPEPDRVIPVFRELELFVSVDTRETVTGRLAHYQIATSGHYEHYDMMAGLEYMAPATFVQMAKPLLQRPEGVIEDWEFFHGLARRMGKTLHMRRPYYGLAHRDIPGPEIAVIDDTKAEDLIRWLVDTGIGSYDELEKHPHGQSFKEAETIIEPAADDDGARLDLCPEDVEAELRVVRRTEDEVPGYPYRLIPRRLIEVMNSAYTGASQTRRRYPTNPIFMNEQDMGRLNVSDGGAVRLTSPTGGVVIGRVRKDLGLQPGVISMCHGWGNPDLPGEQDPDAFSGRLVSLDKDLEFINFMPRQSAVPVDVQRHESA